MVCVLQCVALPAQVTLHRLLCLHRVVLAKALHYLAMLIERLRKPPRQRELLMTCQLQYAAQLTGYPLQPTVS